MNKLGAIILLGIGTTVTLAAAVVPEIDPASGATSIALLGGALVMLRGRRK